MVMIYLYNNLISNKNSFLTGTLKLNVFMKSNNASFYYKGANQYFKIESVPEYKHTLRKVLEMVLFNQNGFF